MADFTPGPWEPRKRYYADFDLPHWEVAYGDMEAHRLVAGYVRTEADARLIAAAPEMLDKLKAAIPYIKMANEELYGSESGFIMALLEETIALLRRIEGEEESE